MAKIIAHRGANKRAPQNTIPAFKKAIELGADGVEFDVQLSKDGVPVICHDFTVDATSDGSGRVTDMTFEELRMLDFGSWFRAADEKNGIDEFTGVQIPTLEETLHCVKNMEIINIEIKRPPNGDMTVVEKTVALVKKFELQSKVIISSFDFKVTDKVKELDESLRVGLLYCPTECDDKDLMRGKFLEVAKKHKAEALHPYYILTKLPKGYIKMCHANGISVNVWGVKGSVTLESYKNSPVDMIITDLI